MHFRNDAVLVLNELMNPIRMIQISVSIISFTTCPINMGETPVTPIFQSVSVCRNIREKSHSNVPFFYTG